jgi:hypothetical protein
MPTNNNYKDRNKYSRPQLTVHRVFRKFLPHKFFVDPYYLDNHPSKPSPLVENQEHQPFFLHVEKYPETENLRI